MTTEMQTMRQLVVETQNRRGDTIEAKGEGHWGVARQPQGQASLRAEQSTASSGSSFQRTLVQDHRQLNRERRQGIRNGADGILEPRACSAADRNERGLLLKLSRRSRPGTDVHGVATGAAKL